MKIHCLGGFGEQGRSALYVEGKSRFLVDYGVKKIEYKNSMGEPPLDDVSKPEFILLTHAHQDHSAMLPLLIESGISVPVYCTLPTKELTIQMCQNWYENYLIRNLEPPYTEKSINKLSDLLVPVPYYKTFEPAKTTKVTFYPSGHMIGSAILYIEDEFTIAHFGDTNFDDRFNPKPYLNFEAEIGIINGSYGDMVMDSKKLRENFMNTVNLLSKNILIPCAAIGRGQEICLMMIEQDSIDKPIYVAKSIINNAKKFLNFSEYLNEQANGLLEKIINSPKLKIVEDGDVQKLISEGSIIIGPDAMLSSGIALKVFNFIRDNEQDVIILNGYMAPGTLGRKLLDAQLPVKAQIKYAELKIHTDIKDNERIIEKVLYRSKLILVHHGEEPKSSNLAKALKHNFTNLDIRAPHTGDRITI